MHFTTLILALATAAYAAPAARLKPACQLVEDGANFRALCPAGAPPYGCPVAFSVDTGFQCCQNADGCPGLAGAGL